MRARGRLSRGPARGASLPVRRARGRRGAGDGRRRVDLSRCGAGGPRARQAAAGRPRQRRAAIVAPRVAGDGLGRGVRAGRVRAPPAAGVAVRGSLLLDDLPFRVRDPGTGRHRIAFRVFAAMGWEAGRARLWRLEAFTSKSQADWEAFLGALDGRAGAGRVRQRRRADRRCARPLPRRRAAPVRVASAPRARTTDEQDPRRASPSTARRSTRCWATSRQRSPAHRSGRPSRSAATPPASRA